MSLFGDEDSAGYNDGAFDASLSLQADEQAGLLPAREQRSCIGHETLEQHLLSAISDGKVPHGLMFTGIKGIGKATFAHRLAKFLLTHDKGGLNDDAGAGLFGDALPEPEFSYTSLDTDPEATDVKLYLASAHPDALTVERPYDDAKDRYKDAIDVESVRKIEPFLRMTASDGGWRIVVIDDADTMNRNSQNALLKILEEPPKKNSDYSCGASTGAIDTDHSFANTKDCVQPAENCASGGSFISNGHAAFNFANARSCGHVWRIYRSRY